MSKTVKYVLGGGVFLGVVVISIGLFLYFMPHRNIQGEKESFSVSAEQLVNDFVTDVDAANAKYLDQVIVVTGTVATIEEDQLEQKVVLLEVGESGVSCTFMLETNDNAEELKEGEEVKIKGVVRLGASYDEDLEMAEFAILEKCDISK